jgi:hypothetical protein
MLRSQNCRSVGFPYQENCTDTVHCTYLHDVASDEEYHRVFDVVFRWKVQVRRNGRQVVTELQRKSDCDVAGVFIVVVAHLHHSVDALMITSCDCGYMILG